MRPDDAPLPTPIHALALVGLSFLLMLFTMHAQALVWSAVTHQPLAVSLPKVSGNMGCLVLAQLIGLGLPALWMLRRRGRKPGLDAPLHPMLLAYAFIAGIALQLPMCELAQLVSRAFPSLAPTLADVAHMEALLAINSPYRALMVPLALVVVAPLTEEFLFRYFVQRTFLAHARRAVVIPVVAMLFAGFHLEPLAFLSITLAGLALGLLADRHQSIRISLAMHAGVNLVPVLVHPSWLAIPGLNAGTPTDHVPLVWLRPSTALFALMFTLAMRTTERSAADPP